MRVRRGLAVSGLMILTMAGLAGCGGGGDDSGDGDRLTRAEFLKQANAICKKGDARIDKEAENIDDEADTEEVAAFIEDTVLPETRAQVDDVDDLKPPENLADDVDEALAATRRALDKVEDDPEGAIEDGEEIFADANERLNDLGLTECGDDNESDDEGSDDEGLTESEFTTQGNALCQEFQDGLEVAGEEAFPGEDEPSGDELSEFLVDTIIPAYEDLLDQLSELRPPADIESDVERAIEASRKSARAVKRDTSVLDGDDDPFKESDPLLEAVGLDVCAE